MNTTFNSALKQRTAIRRDLDALSNLSPQDPTQPPRSLTPAALGSLSASLAAFSRTVDEYSALAKQELNATKQEKAYERIRDFRAEIAEFRTRLDALKAAREDAQLLEARSELLGRRPFAAATPENPYAAGASTASSYGARAHDEHRRGRGLTGRGGSSPFGSGDAAREAHALREQHFFQNTHAALDEYIARGQAVLGDLGQQREMLKSTQRKLYSVGNTLGISGDTIRMIERRAKEDKWIFLGGVVVFFLFCWLVLHYLR
ncbi:hypothetical protein VTJ83DRAFT_5200 [Remersonia thermophila]|uniref:Protein transport protein BOS1 n=1 Tax=Remersonia thermophila TaxID=72144 RepID=A0ABR4DC46_9PEZI